MGHLDKLLYNFALEYNPQLGTIYQWPLPKTIPSCDFVPQDESDASACLRLRRALHERWKSHPRERQDLERWYVADWGGVRANRPVTMTRYSDTSDEGLITHGVRGIASWSKILSIRNPTKYQIYDARVGAALNALQIIETGRCDEAFPSVPSRNRVISGFQQELRKHSQRTRSLASSAVYGRYLQLAANGARAIATSGAEHVEMALFAQAEDLADKATARMQQCKASNAKP